MILSGHVDTVIADANFSTDPFSLVVKNGKAYGLGVIDMKCYFSTIIDSLEELSKQNIPIIITITSDEETDL